MKKHYAKKNNTNLFLPLLLVVVMIFGAKVGVGQGFETFENHPLSGTSYADGSYVGDNGVTWNYVQCTGEQGYPIEDKGILLRRSDAPSKIYSESISGGIGSFSVQMRKAFTGTGDRQVALFINNSWIADSQTFGNASGEDETIHTFSVNDINIPGNVVIEIRHITGNTSNRQLVIDNLEWTGFTVSVPTLLLAPQALSGFLYREGSGPSPSQSFTVNGINLSPETGNVTVSATGQNYEVSTDDNSFYSSVDLLYSDGELENQTIHVRLKAGISAGLYENEEIEVSGGGATTVNLLVGGEVTPPPPGLPYGEDFSSFTSVETLPNGWELDDEYTHQGIFGSGTAGGLRGEGVLGFQLTSSAPNDNFAATLLLENNTGEVLTNLLVEYTGKVARTDQTGTPKWVVSVNEVEYSELEYNTEDGVDKSISFVVTGLNIPPGELIEIEWFTTSDGTSGTRRQIGITDVKIEVTEPLSETTWLGMGWEHDEQWGNANNWTNGVPDATTDAIIPGGQDRYPVVGPSTSANVRNITLHDRASLLDNGRLNIEGTFTMERDLTLGGWEMISSPVSGMTILGSDFAPDDDPLPSNFDFYYFNEAASLPWINLRAADGSVNQDFDETFAEGKGYLVAYFEDTFAANPFSFIGEMNTGDVDVALNHNQIESNDWAGWNLVGNPYPSGYDWVGHVYDDVLANDYAYIYNPGAEQYEGLDDVVIAPNQGFFVLAKEGAGTLTFLDVGRKSYFPPVVKSETQPESLVLRFGNDERNSPATIRIDEGSEFGTDRRDAFKLFSLVEEMPELFTKTSDGDRLSINSVPELDTDMVFPVGLKVPANGTYFISLNEASGQFAGLDVYLYDSVTETEVLLSDVQTYTFQAQGNLDNIGEPRFQLGFKSIGETTGINDPAASYARIFSYNNTLVVEFNQTVASGVIEVFDLSGRMLLQQKLEQTPRFSRALDLMPGVYVVRVSDNNKTQTERVFIQ